MYHIPIPMYHIPIPMYHIYVEHTMMLSKKLLKDSCVNMFKWLYIIFSFNVEINYYLIIV